MHYLVFRLFELFLHQPLVGRDALPKEIHMQYHQLARKEEQHEPGQHTWRKENMPKNAWDRGKQLNIHDPGNDYGYQELQVIDQPCVYKHEERSIVILPYAIIEPFPMMVELAHTPVAWFAVLGGLLDVGKADIAHEDEFWVVHSGVYQVHFHLELA